MYRNASRRALLAHAARFGVLGAAAPLGLSLAAASRASAASLNGGYKALVCVFLYGGNDGHNTVVPCDLESHRRYGAARGAVAVPLADLSATVLDTANGFGNGQRFALHPSLSALMPHFDAGRMSLLMNVGPLLAPTTLADYRAGRNLPPKLMSHNDQFNLWQTSMPEGAASGWGGRIGDILASANGDADLLTNLTVGAGAAFSTGRSSQEFAIGPAGPVDIEARYSGVARRFDVVSTINQNLRAESEHLLERELTRRYKLIQRGNRRLKAALAGQQGFGLPATALGAKLDMVARLVAANQSIGVQRQVFFIDMGGFDNHGNLNTAHPLLLKELGDALAAFQSTIDGLGMADQVTTFTASDFGRSLTSNGRGSDHGWGGHHFVMGGAVNARRWVGAAPSLTLGAEDDIGQGRLLPAISVDQMGASLGRWMGLSATEQRDVFPNLVNFDQQTLEFIDWNRV